MRKSQSALEFVILIGVMLFLFTSLTLTFNRNLSQKTQEQRSLEIQNLASSIQNEIDLAASSSTGYQRTFKVPDKILNIEYNISIISNFLYLRTSDNKHAISLPIQNLSGQLQFGDNTLKKNVTGVFLNK